jgi:tRNA(fMet)-specific endonuclease VapC
MYLLDTNVLSEPTRPEPSPKLLSRLRQHRDALATAAIVWYELNYGIERLPPSARRDALRRYVRALASEGLPILPYSQAAAEWHAAERARLTSLGRPAPSTDGQIAAIAAVNGLVLVTANAAGFAQFRDVRVENWV